MLALQHPCVTPLAVVPVMMTLKGPVLVNSSTQKTHGKSLLLKNWTSIESLILMRKQCEKKEETN